MNPIPRELLHFLLLDREQQEQAIRRLAASGMSVHTIASATRMSVEQIQLVLEQPAAARPSPRHVAGAVAIGAASAACGATARARILELAESPDESLPFPPDCESG